MPEPGLRRRNSSSVWSLLPLRYAASAPRRCRLGRAKPLMNVRGELMASCCDDVAPHRIGGGGGQGDGRRIAEHAAKVAEPGVVGPKVVPPLADAVGLVDGQQLEARRRAPPRETAGCGTARARRRPARTRPPPCLPAGRTVRPGRSVLLISVTGSPLASKLVDLVLHQRDQRRDHQRQARRAPRPATGSTGSCRRRSASRTGNPARRAPLQSPRVDRAETPTGRNVKETEQDRERQSATLRQNVGSCG